MNQADKIICIGKNYRAHAEEMAEALPQQPLVFLKPFSVLKQQSQWGETLWLEFPQAESDLHYEIEVVLKLKMGGYQLSADEARQALGWVSPGLDMTKRVLQTRLKKAGHPWTPAKVFKDAAIVGPWLSLHEFPDYLKQPFAFYLNGELRQQALPAEMLVSPEELISYLSYLFPLCVGDLIFTGTPAGVGAVTSGSQARLSWAGYEYFVGWR